MANLNISLKNKKATDRVHAHTDVFIDDTYIGYITTPKVNTVDGLWHFSSKSDNYVSIGASSKKELLNRLNK